jgi:signal transduction histidine kinase
MPVSLWFDPKIHLAWHAAPVLETAFVVLAARRMLGLRIGWLWVILVPGVVLPLLVWTPGSDLFSKGLVLIGLPVIALCFAHLSWIGLRAALRDGSALGLWLSLAISVALLCWLMDLMVIANVLSERRILFTRSVYPLFTSVLAACMILRIVSFLHQADHFAQTLKQRVNEAEQALRASFARDQANLQASALALERSRLMRDLHDGVGGQLVSIVASAERPDADPRVIGDAARMALRDMRLVIDAMDDVGGELMLVLATWRERAETRLRSMDIELHWIIESDTGLPTFEGLRPVHVLNILRILEEAVTNVIKHSGARNLRLSLRTVRRPSGALFGSICLRDDGKGGVVDRFAGRGLSNMMQRAATVNGALTITSDSTGTLVQLDIPALLPAPR